MLFPYLGHGHGSGNDLQLWLVVGAPDAAWKSFRAWAQRLALRASHLVDGQLVSLRATGLGRLSEKPQQRAEERLDAALTKLHAAHPIALALRDNRVTRSPWHKQTIQDPARILAVLEKMISRSDTYAFPAVHVGTLKSPDINEILLEISRHRLQARFLENVLRKLATESKGAAARAVLDDLLLERLPSMLDRDFDSDVIVRHTLAQARGIGAATIEMSERFRSEAARRITERHKKQKPSVVRSPSEIDWRELTSVRRAISAEQWLPLYRALNDTDPAHAQTLLALTPDERLSMVRHHSLGTVVANIAVQFLGRGDFQSALVLYDAAIEAALPALAAANPLFAVQNDNNHLGVDERRARRYLERCLPHGSENPTIFLNASFVFIELGDGEECLRMLELARARGVVVKKYRNEALFVPLRDEARFKKLMR